MALLVFGLWAWVVFILLIKIKYEVIWGDMDNPRKNNTANSVTKTNKMYGVSIHNVGEQ